MSRPPSDDEDEIGETAPAPLFEQEQAVVSALARSVRLWRTLARMRSLGLPGTEEVRVGRFVLEDVLGEGGMSVVFAARDPELGQRVALKMLNQAMHAAQATRLLREGQALAKIKSDHVIKVLEIGRYEEAMYLALERVEGVSLDQWLKAQRPAPSGILDLMIQAARGLAAAHVEGLVHRDVKPQNIMVAAPAAAGAAPRVYVVDFGLVSASVNAAAGDGAAVGVEVAEGLTATGALVGTLHYMAPEQASGGLTDARTDVYGLCVVIYEAVFGQLPHAAGQKEAVLEAIRSGPPRTPPIKDQTQREIWAALRRGLASARADRYGSMEALCAALERIRGRRARLRRRAVVLGGALAMGGMVVLGAALVPDQAALHRELCVARGEEVAAALVVDQARWGRPLVEKTDAFRRRWAAAWRGTCDIDFVPEKRVAAGTEQAPRRACLEEIAGAVAGDLRLLEEAEAGEYQTIATNLRLAAWPSVEACARAASWQPGSTIGPAAEESATRLRSAIEAARAALLIDDDAAATAMRLEEVIAEAGALGHARAEAEAGIELGKIRRRGGLGGEMAALVAAEQAAVRAGDYVMMLQVLLERGRASALDPSVRGAGEARVILEFARAWLEPLDTVLRAEEKRILRATALDLEGLVEFSEGSFEEAIAAHKSALEALGAEGEDDAILDVRLVRAIALVNLGRALSAAGRVKEGSMMTKTAVAREVEIFGAVHSELVEGLTGLAIDLSDLGYAGHAEVYARMAVERSYYDSQQIEPRLLLAILALGRKDWTRAAQEAVAAREIAAAVGRPYEADQAELLGIVAAYADRPELCAATLTSLAALATRARARGDDALVASVGETVQRLGAADGGPVCAAANEP